MKKQLSALALGLSFLVSLSGMAQERKIIPCYTNEATEAYFEKYPEARKEYAKNQKTLKDAYSQLKSTSALNKAAAFVYTVPVVFQVLHLGGGENVSDADLIAALAQINSDFARMGADVNTIAQPFQNLYINSDITFMLAKKDPNGNCTNGIVHRYDARTDWDQANLAYYNGITWDPTKYLNIIIVKGIIPQGPVAGGGTIVGYTRIPGTVQNGSAMDCIVYDSGFLSGLQVRSMSHEIGHWLGLPHTFGNTNNPGVTCGDDGLYDTPPTKGSYGSCPSSMSGNVCAGATTVYLAGQDNPENIMDYSSCPKNFTTDQTNLMRTVLASNVNSRSNLSQPSNLIATDVNGLGACAPKVEFISTNASYTVCKGGSLTMRDYSYNGNITNYQWVADNGAVINSSTNSVTAISFPNLGVSNVTLTVSNNVGSASKVRNIVVIDGAAQLSGVFQESFENVGVPLNWQSINLNPGSGFWEQNTDASYDGSASFYVQGAICGAKQEDYLITPVFDVLNNPNNKLEFAYAYCKKNASQSDVLKIQASHDCGGTWQDITSLTATFMANKTGGTSATPYVPAFNEWAIFNISDFLQWSTQKNYPSVQVRFNFVEGTVGGGNNMFIDAIRFYNPDGTNGVNDLTKSIEFGVFPNPTNNEANIRFVLSDVANIKYSVTDILGKEVISGTERNYSAGEQNLTINSNSELSRGVYFVNLSLNGAKMSKKLVVN